jgi:hypothetical protein
VAGATTAPSASCASAAPEASVARDWERDRVWFEHIASAIIDNGLASLTDAIGQVVAGERKATKEAIDAVRAELTEAIAARPAEVEIAARLAHIKSAGLEHLDRCLARMAKADAALGLSCADIGLLPN